MNNKIQGVIFDFNGVLFLDSHLHERAWREYSKIVRGEEFSDEEMHKYMHGRTNKDIIEYLAGSAVEKDYLDSHTQKKESIYRDFCVALGDELKLSPGAVELLNYLKVSNIPRTIATASEVTNLKFFWEVFNLGNWFKFDDIAYDNGNIKGKPAPDLYLAAARKLELSPENCLVVEDSISGIESAKNANIGMIVAIGPLEKHDLLSKVDGVDIVISDFHELVERMYAILGQ